MVFKMQLFFISRKKMSIFYNLTSNTSEKNFKVKTDWYFLNEF